MKKLILLTVIIASFQVETEASSNTNLTKTTISATSSEVNMVVKRRRKKGFLWGIFKKKDCGCPKH
ncbi:hypothetical protein VB796_02040 [Arcicella sp. LKC2W]|uniref:hypothetical protein n=1 Tax=Arcicella sp. LKC2W TaxID=2984198 RepID=UPI002B1E9205|nr:hypothetical protein [Arcicella sp. LKC2W]MEA5457799.1 hypothetical protein [Arcicella sp. LKC2W]